jgi:hypothetical protein
MMIQRSLVWSRRALALLGVVAALYFAIGSSLFPGWYYGLFWNGGLTSADDWAIGVDYWVETPIVPITVGAALVVTIFIVRRNRARFWQAIDRFGYYLILGSVTGVLLTAFFVHQVLQPSYEALQPINLFNAALRQYEASSPKLPTIQPPIDFQFIDKDRVQALYNQIEPDLIEAQRNVETSTDTSAKAGVKAGVAEAEVGGSKRQQDNSLYKRVESSPERECVEVMDFQLGRSQIQYYTDGRQWINRRAALNFHTGLAQIDKDFEVAKKAAPIKPLPLEEPLAQPPSKEEQEAAERQLKQYEDLFNTELSSLQGMVIVDGEFTATRSADGNALLVERFADKPRRVDFRFTAPSTPELTQIVSIGRTHLRVFGTVLKPLGADGVIEVRPIAVY